MPGIVIGLPLLPHLLPLLGRALATYPLMHHMIQHLQCLLLVRGSAANVDVARNSLLASRVATNKFVARWHGASAVDSRYLVAPHLLLLQLHQLLL